MRENREFTYFVLCILLGSWCQTISTYPQSVTENNKNNNNNIAALKFNDKSNATIYDYRRNVGVAEIITKAENVRFSQTNENENFTGILENALNTQQHQRQSNRKSSKVFQQIDLLTSTSPTLPPPSPSSSPSSLSSPSSSLASTLATSVLERDSLTTASVTLPSNSTKVDDNVAIDVVDGRPHKIELSTKAFDVTMTTTMNSNDNANAPIITPLDLSDFLALIPAQRVQNIIRHYYHNDPEVKRAYSFMSSSEFARLKEHIIAVPEMSAFLRYLNNSGLDLVKFVNAIANLTNKIDDASPPSYRNDNNELMATHDVVTRKTDVGLEQKLSSLTALQVNETNGAITATETSLAFVDSSTTGEALTTTTIEEHFSGLHGLFDSILEALPQDQILATFFDKLETNEEFSKLFDDIGSPAFAKILENMQDSLPLRHLIFTLHNNDIYVMKMVDSLKSYFFLGTF
uniref:Protein G12 n=1 Tax=Glossina pallidipes TaxID=7398 RepID=A0A1B0AB34_GLOPL